MKKIFNTSFNPQLFDIILLITRVTIASFMLVHGWPKFSKIFSGEELTFADPIGIGELPSLFLTVFSEVVCSIFIFIGLGTRLAVIPLLITMLVAAIIVHSSDGFTKQEMALHYILIYLILLVTGSGKYSIDEMLNKKS